MIKLPNLKGLTTIGKSFVMANRPELLFGASIVSTLGAVVMAAKGGYESGQEVLAKELGYESYDSIGDREELHVKEKIQLTWLNYLPAAGLTGAAIGSTTGLHLVHVKEKKAIAAAALMAIDEVRKEGKEYTDRILAAVEEATDEEKRQEIVDNALDPDKDGVCDMRGSDDDILEELYLVRDGKTGRDIWSNKNKIEDAVNHVNQCIAKQGDCELNTFYSLAGFDNTPDGDDWGWSGDFLELKWDTTTRTDQRPVQRFTFRTAPKEGYDRGAS